MSLIVLGSRARPPGMGQEFEGPDINPDTGSYVPPTPSQQAQDAAAYQAYVSGSSPPPSSSGFSLSSVLPFVSSILGFGTKPPATATARPATATSALSGALPWVLGIGGIAIVGYLVTRRRSA